MSDTDSPRSSGRARRLAGEILRGSPWLLLLAAATGGFVFARDHLDKVYATLGYLLIVLGASSRRGRLWGIGVAVLAFLCFNFFLLPPYYTLALRDPLDWVVLGSFLVTAAVSAQLLDRARSEAAEARARAEEVNRFAAIGAEALNAGRAEEGLHALLRILRETLGSGACDAFLFDSGTDSLRPVGAGAEPEPDPDDPDLLRYAARFRSLVVRRPYGDVHVERAGQGLDRVLDELPSSDMLLIPLAVRERTVGVLRIGGGGRRPDAAQVRFVEALAYYLALGVERVRLVAEEERATALREANRLKDAMLAAVSHDLRTPLTTIKALAEELRERETSAAVIEAEADRLNRFVGDLLDLSRLESGSLSVKPEVVPADDLLGAALQQMSAVAPASTFVTHMADESIPAGRMDFVFALRCLVNLLENACKYGGAAPVEVTVAREGEAVVFTVADGGPGIPPEERERIFEPFYRGRRVPDGGGTGLGLSIARQLARAQGGDVRYEPRQGGGSQFALVLPAADAALPAESPA